MKQSLIKYAIRTRFFLTGRNQASNQIRNLTDRYLSLAGSIDLEAGRRVVRVPPMLGVDEDMREWSFLMILEHNVIVNKRITTTIQRLVHGGKPTENKDFDPKRDVMPSANPGDEQIAAFRASVVSHLDCVSRLPRLRPTPTSRHPIFGELNAHGWHCMFGLHLDIHWRQAKAAVALVEQL